jgi:hypothetical protein
MEFWLTRDDAQSEPNVLKRIQNESCYDVEMFRAFQTLPGIDPVKHLGHRPLFPDSHEFKLSPHTYISRHY